MDKCACCKKALSECKEVHAVEGKLYCSQSCAIQSKVGDIYTTAMDVAKNWYNNYAEVVRPEDIGIAYQHEQATNARLIEAMREKLGLLSYDYDRLSSGGRRTYDEIISILAKL